MTLLHQEWKDAVFFTAQNGQSIPIRTDVTLSLDLDLVKVQFRCKDNPYLAFNRYQQDNDPLYNQEVFEIFISGGREPSENYLEIEANPNGALWAGIIQNPEMGLAGHPLKTTFLTRDSDRIHLSTWKKADEWGGLLTFPLSLIPGYPAEYFRFNFYRIVAKTQPENDLWVCDVDNAHFLCLYPTLSGDQPAFHRPLMFGQLANPIEASM